MKTTRPREMCHGVLVDATLDPCCRLALIFPQDVTASGRHATPRHATRRHATPRLARYLPRVPLPSIVILQALQSVSDRQAVGPGMPSSQMDTVLHVESASGPCPVHILLLRQATTSRIPYCTLQLRSSRGVPKFAA